MFDTSHAPVFFELVCAFRDGSIHGLCDLQNIFKLGTFRLARGGPEFDAMTLAASGEQGTVLMTLCTTKQKRSRIVNAFVFGNAAEAMVQEEACNYNN